MTDNKDRRSRMATSSVNQPMRKGGAGGFSWGHAMDVQDYHPVDHGVQKMVVAPAPATVTMPVTYVAQPAVPVPLTDASHFPSLGGAVPTTVVGLGGGAWGPAPGMHAQVAAAQSAVRTDVTYDSTHPRNAFARKPHTKSSGGSAIVPAEVAQPMIDWSQAGTQAIQQTMLHVAAHPPPVVHAQPAVPLSVLRAQPHPVTIVPAIQKGYPTKPQFSSRPMVTQPRGR
eukprot:TRINITY_DN1741_c0_g1_i1.p1 TRINITY_DN1741_c0_g1~~TRINITY_DN1741_c0_g1_i1.p1  ORF type:complete len:227 (-),score=40.60 TRINITY_DN1741_c0_g1_i1:72-752(-)